MASIEPRYWQIYRILIFKRGQDIGSLKIIAQNESSAYKIARNAINQSVKLRTTLISLRLLMLQRLPYSIGQDRVLQSEGVR